MSRHGFEALPSKRQRDQRFWLGALAILLGAAALSLAVRSWNTRPGEPTGGDSYASLRHTDLRLITYQSLLTIPVKMERPSAVALDRHDHIFAAGDRVIRSFGEHPVPDIPLQEDPQCLAIDDRGQFFVGFSDHVEVMSRDGKLESRWSLPGPRACLTSLAVGGGFVWVADAGDRVVLRCSPSGQVLARIGERDPERGIPGLVVPSPHLDVAPDTASRVWVTNPGRHRLELYAGDAALVTSWGIPSASIEGFSGCCNPTDIARCPDGSIVTAEKGLRRLKHYARDGRLLGVIAAPESLPQDDEGLDLAVDSRGRVIALDPAARVIRIYVPMGKTVGI